MLASGSGTARFVAPTRRSPRRSVSGERSSEIDTDDDSHLEVSVTKLRSLYHGSTHGIDGVSLLDTEDSLKTTRRATVRPPMVIKGVSKKARQDTRLYKCTDIGRTAPPTPWEVNAVLRKASPLISMIVDRYLAAVTIYT